MIYFNVYEPISDNLENYKIINRFAQFKPNLICIIKHCLNAKSINKFVNIVQKDLL